jgi:hypothetical protein
LIHNPGARLENYRHVEEGAYFGNHSLDSSEFSYSSSLLIIKFTEAPQKQCKA